MDRLTLKHGIWVVVADGEKALIFENRGDAKFPDLHVVEHLHEENPPTREQGSDRPGRFNDGPSAHRSAVADTDWHRIAKERFADEISGWLYKASHRGDFHDVVIVAPPVVLGEIRRKLHKELGAKVRAEIAKTLTNMPVSDIENLLVNG